MVLLATWAGLRFGEAAGLQRRDIDLETRSVRVDRQLQELKGGELVEGPPKTDAGLREIALPPHVIPDLARHLAAYVGADPWSYVFTSPDGSPLRRSNFNRRVWQPACASAEITGVRFHDLRHTGTTFAASAGASTKELMARMGHASARAALIYQHATRDRDHEIAAAMTRQASDDSGGAPVLHLVLDAESECAMDAPSRTSAEPTTVHRGEETPDQTRGDDGTRTHDPLLAKQVL